MADNQPSPVELPHAGWYILPTAEAFLGLVQPRDKEPARVRFDLGDGRTLDIPLSPNALARLSDEIRPLLPPLSAQSQ